MALQWLGSFGSFLETLDRKRDHALTPFIKRWWPRQITPNFLTGVRIAISALLTSLLFVFGIDTSLVIMPLFCFGALTDLFDGSVARVLGKETPLGAVIDPIADRLLVIPIAIYSLFDYQRTLLLLLIVLELANAILSFYVRRDHIAVSSNIFGKTKMVMQSVAFVAILLFWPHEPNIFFISLLWISLIFLVASIVFKIAQIELHLSKIHA